MGIIESIRTKNYDLARKQLEEAVALIMVRKLEEAKKRLSASMYAEMNLKGFQSDDNVEDKRGPNVTNQMNKTDRQDRQISTSDLAGDKEKPKGQDVVHMKQPKTIPMRPDTVNEMNLNGFKTDDNVIDKRGPNITNQLTKTDRQDKQIPSSDLKEPIEKSVVSTQAFKVDKEHVKESAAAAVMLLRKIMQQNLEKERKAEEERNKKVSEKNKDLKEEELAEARIKIIKARVRGGKIQRRKKVSNVPGMTLRGGKLQRMSPAERRKRKMGARRAKIKIKGKRTQMLMKRKRSMMKRKSMGL